MTFDEWMKAIDEIVWQAAGCSVYDLMDQPFRDWYDKGLTPNKAAQLTLESEGIPD